MAANHFEAPPKARRGGFSAQPMEVSGDAVLWRSAAENVVRNAIRHTARQTEVPVMMAKADGLRALPAARTA